MGPCYGYLGPLSLIWCGAFIIVLNMIWGPVYNGGNSDEAAVVNRICKRQITMKLFWETDIDWFIGPSSMSLKTAGWINQWIIIRVLGFFNIWGRFCQNLSDFNSLFFILQYLEEIQKNKSKSRHYSQNLLFSRRVF